MFAALNAFQVGAVPTLVSDVFSTTLYTGNGSTQTITNGIDLAGKGGLVWLKSRSGADPHELTNTVQGTSNSLRSNSTNGASSTDLTGFTSSGFTLGYVTGNTNASGATEVSWTFRKQAKFFDIVTYTGDGSSYQTISHSLSSTPGCIIIKGTSGSTNWGVYHQSIPTGYLTLNTTNADTAGLGFFQNVGSTSFETAINTNGVTYVAYIFAHNAGGFGVTGSDNIISCGSYTGSSGSGQSINLGYQPQWLLVKNTSRASTNWVLMDKYRNFDNTGYGWLYPNLDAAEDSGTATVYVYPTSTGFTTVNANANTDYLSDSYIYIAIKDNS